MHSCLFLWQILLFRLVLLTYMFNAMNTSWSQMVIFSLDHTPIIKLGCSAMALASGTLIEYSADDFTPFIADLFIILRQIRSPPQMPPSVSTVAASLRPECTLRIATCTIR